MLQENPESESVRDQQYRNDEGGNEVCGSQLPRQEPRVIPLVKGIQEIDGSPDVEDPAKKLSSVCHHIDRTG